MVKWLHASKCHLVWRYASAQATLCHMGPRSPSQKKGGAPSPIFGPFLLWPNGWMDQDTTLVEVRRQPWGLCVRLGPSHLPKRGGAPKFWAHVCCGQTAAWIKMPLGTEVGFGLEDIVLDEDPASPPQKGGGAPLLSFRPTSVVAKWLDGSRWHLARR